MDRSEWICLGIVAALIGSLIALACLTDGKVDDATFWQIMYFTKVGGS